MLGNVLAEVLGVITLAIGAGLFWIARPKDGNLAPFLRKSYTVEVGYTLLLTFLLAGGVGGIILGVTG
jgi:hypothetical protein